MEMGVEGLTDLWSHRSVLGKRFAMDSNAISARISSTA
jgi:hypothetical protein